MLFKTYGRTGKQVSAVSFGGMRFANPKNHEAAVEVVLHAHRKGINYFDTAPHYCDDQSEDIMGLALKHMKPGSYYISTKCMASQAADLRSGLEKSLKRLGVPKIHFFHIWCFVRPEEWEGRKKGGAVAEAQKAKEEGLIEHLVFSTHLFGPHNLPIIQEGVFEGMLLGYSAINFPFRQAAVDAAGAAGLGVVTMNPLAGGLIPDHAQRFDFIRSPGDADVVTAAIRFNISQPAITSTLVGFTTTQQIDQAVAAVEGFRPYSAEHMSRLKTNIEEGFDGLCTGCGYCLPCPSGIEIPKMMDAYNEKILRSDDQAISNRLKWHWGLSTDMAAKCTECAACEKACTQRLPIIERMRYISQVK